MELIFISKYHTFVLLEVSYGIVIYPPQNIRTFARLYFLQVVGCVRLPTEVSIVLEPRFGGFTT